MGMSVEITKGCKEECRTGAGSAAEEPEGACGRNMEMEDSVAKENGK